MIYSNLLLNFSVSIAFIGGVIILCIINPAVTRINPPRRIYVNGFVKRVFHEISIKSGIIIKIVTANAIAEPIAVNANEMYNRTLFLVGSLVGSC